MLRKFLDYPLSLTEKGKPLHAIKPLITANDTFLYEAPLRTKHGPHIRDAIDIKRWMIMVVFALIPCILWAIWNTGLQSFVYTSGNYQLMDEYLSGSQTLQGYFNFASKEGRTFSIIQHGLYLFLPQVIIAYAVGGFWEVLFACIRRHEVSEGFLVTGILYALILPPTLPYWMTAIGVSAGVVLGKEVFGGSGMNIVNPALACRAFLFFTFPGRMSGKIWVGGNPAKVRESLYQMNQAAKTGPLDSYTQATKLANFNVTPEIKSIHVDAIASNNLGNQVNHFETLQKYFSKWVSLSGEQATLGELTQDQMRSFVTTSMPEGGLGLSPGFYEDAYSFSSLNYGLGHNGDWNLFFGDRLGSMGSTSVFCIILGALFLIYTGIASWRTMVSMALGAFVFASLFEWGAKFFGAEGGALAPAQFSFPAYKHLLLGGLPFGLVFMATDPVSSADMNSAKWLYGAFCGVVTIVIRAINPAYPEGVMLAILMGNVFAPLFDYYAARNYRKRRMRRARPVAA